MTHYATNSRLLSQYEFNFNSNLNYLFDLSYLGLLDVQGDNANVYLQGQLTSDLRKLSKQSMVPAGLCNLKGRLLALMDVVQWQGIHLILPQDLIDSTQQSLAQTALLSRISLKKNSEFKLLGFYLQNIKDLLPTDLPFSAEMYAQQSGSDYCYYHLGHGLYVFIIPASMEAKISQPFIEKKQFLGSLSWHTLKLLHHQFEIYPESRGLFLPHKVDLQKTAYLSFDKGCYKGQEVIARMHYKAVLKHELQLYTIQTEERLYSGQKMFHEDREIGELVDYSPLAQNCYLIAASLLKDAPSLVLFENHQESIMLTKASSSKTATANSVAFINFDPASRPAMT